MFQRFGRFAQNLLNFSRFSSVFIEDLVPTMKRITKDRSSKTSTTSSTSTRSKTRAIDDVQAPKTRKKKDTSTKSNSPLKDTKLMKDVVDNKGKESITTKFKVEDKPKVGSKRCHLKVEYEDDPTLLSPDIKVKEEPKDLPEIKVESDGIKQDVPQIKEECIEMPLPSPTKLVKVEDVHVKGKGKIPNPRWEEMLHNLREMRKDFNAPVDTMGCDMCMDKSSDPKDARYQALLSLMLSSMTKDNVTYAAMQKLIAHGCTVDKMLEISDERLAELIYPVNYWKKKVQYIKESTKMIKEEFDGDIPKTVKDLCKLKGVGPKMAHLCMKTAWDEITGIGVDTHVHRISNRMGWVQSKNPEGTRTQLEDWLPKDLWQEVNHLLVGFGQQVCQPVRPQCATCLNNEICPFGIVHLKKK